MTALTHHSSCTSQMIQSVKLLMMRRMTKARTHDIRVRMTN